MSNHVFSSRSFALPTLLLFGLFMAVLVPSSAFATTVNSNCISPDPVVFTTAASTPSITLTDIDQAGSTCDDNDQGLHTLNETVVSTTETVSAIGNSGTHYTFTQTGYADPVNGQRTIYAVSITTLVGSGSDFVRLYIDPGESGTASTPIDIQVTLPGSAAPTVSSISPTSGSTLGGTAVTITGTGFTGATALTIGGTAATGVTVVSATSITATTPAHAAGAASVLVTTSGGTNAANSLFTYVAPPTVSAISPSAGPTAGGTAVTITGTGFTGATALTIGGTAATGITVLSATSITATTPAHAAGTASVLVTTSGGTNAANSLFTYVAPPTVSAISPTSGSTLGGTAVTITGTGFTGATALTIGGTAATGVTVVSATSITATTPAHAAGAASVLVTTSGGTNAANSLFTYVAPPTVSAISPSAGPTAGGTAVTITGTGFTGATALTIGGTAATGITVLSATSITATTPAHAAGAASVLVTTSGGTNAANSLYTYVAAPTVSGISPSSGTTVGGTSVTITGTGFTGATALKFGGTNGTSVTVVSATQITATSPAGTGTVDVTVTTAGGTSATGVADQFTYVAAPTAGAVSATVAYNSTANPITLNLGGGTASSVTVASVAPHGTATASGTSITYTPTSGYAGPDSFTYTATNAGGTSAPATVAITVSAPSIILTPVNNSTLSGTAETPYTQTFAASGGATPYTYALTVISGTLPTGISFSAGLLSGTPTTAGTVSFTVKATDNSTGAGAPFSVTNSYSLTIAAPTIVLTPVTLPTPVIGAAYTAQTITASGGNGSYTFSIISGAIPAGMSFNSGVLSGTPTAAGSFSFTVQASDGNSFAGTRTYSFTVAAPTVTLAPDTVPGGTSGIAYVAQTITASGGTAPYTYSISSGALPPGLGINASSGVISGTPTAPNAYNFTVKAVDNSTGTGAPFSGSLAYTIVIRPAAPTAGPVSASIGYDSTSNAITLNLGGGAANSVAIGTAAAHGTATAIGNAISYTPTAGFFGSDSFTYTASNVSGTSSAATVSITVAAPTITITPAILAAGAIGATYNQALTATGGQGPYAFASTPASGALPAGLSISSSGVITGTPTAGGTFTFSVSGTDGSTLTPASFISSTLSLTVAGAAPVVTPATGASFNATAEAAFSQTVSTSGGTAPYNYSVASGALPAGLTLNAASGVLSGTPSVSGTFAFNVLSTDSSTGSGPYSSTVSYSITVVAPTLLLPAQTLPDGTVSITYAGATFSASGGLAPYAYTLTSGALPTGLNLDPNTGALSGTPTAGGLFTIGITATDADLFTVTQTYGLNVDAGSGNATLTSSLNPSTFGQNVTFTVIVTAGSAPNHAAASTSSMSGKTDAVPTGLVTFSDNGTPLTSISLDPAGMATYATRTLGAGSHTIAVEYAGDSSTAASGATLVQQVNMLAPALPIPALDRWAFLGLVLAAGLIGARYMHSAR